MKKKHTGFTLIELMVMLAVLAVVVSVGVPQLTIFLKGGKMVTNTNDLVGGLHAARSAAIKTAGRVTICKSKNADDDLLRACFTGGTDGWEKGWFVFVEGTDVGNLIGTYTSTDGAVLRVNTGTVRDATTITTTDTAIQDYVSFSSRGLPTKSNGVGVSGTFMVCDDRGLKNASGNVVANGIRLEPTGRAGATKTESKIGLCP